ncbi:MAG: HAD family hydrolase [Deltaproteobacteria bacterium]|nr:HAD family hydrolase [Deltaproteobacteria bacterium]
MILIQRPGQPPIDIEHLLIDYEGTLASDGRVHPKAKDKINLLAKRISVYILTKGEREKIEEHLRKLKAEILFFMEGEASGEKLDLLRRLGPEKTVAIGNGVDDAPMLEEAGFSICVIGREGASGETLKRADMVVTDILSGLDFLLKPLRQKATLGK